MARAVNEEHPAARRQPTPDFLPEGIEALVGYVRERAPGIGLAVEALNQPGELNTSLYGDFVALVAGLLEAA